MRQLNKKHLIITLSIPLGVGFLFLAGYLVTFIPASENFWTPPNIPTLLNYFLLGLAFLAVLAFLGIIICLIILLVRFIYDWIYPKKTA